eukprot:TRINITY_DN4988_c0_g1_i6.p1 TRINITY_DN4988_c0_g1~~TRINITY_DN4988_c0_g1_i6.p1  ORF type:complete len:157 (-),score=23.23 TRINITY_DN4988_c0_g1_i6:43-513(-)
MVELSRAVLPLLRENRGRLVNVSSVAGLIAFPTTASYCVSKHAIEAWSDAMRRELEEWVSVSIIEPGFFKTNFTDPVAMRRALETAVSRAPQEAVQAYGGVQHLADVGELQRKITAAVASTRTGVVVDAMEHALTCLLYTSPSPRDRTRSRMPSSA